LIDFDLRSGNKQTATIRYVGEKTPLNIFHVGTLFKWFPEAIVLFIYRNPILVLQSEVNKRQKPDYPIKKSNKFYAYGLVVFVFLEWVLASVIGVIYKYRRNQNFIIVSYEQLALSCADSVRAISRAVDIEYSDDLCEEKKWVLVIRRVDLARFGTFPNGFLFFKSILQSFFISFEHFGN